jgi:hypothetical protein
MQPFPVMEDVVQEKSAVSSFLLKVYLWMVTGLGITSVISLGIEFGLPGLKWTMIEYPFIWYGLLILEFALVWILSATINKMPAIIAIGVFFFYAALNGVTFGVLFMFFNLGSIFLTFAVTAGMFAGMSVIGFVTKMDLSRIGAFLSMALIGLIIAMIANMFLNASFLEYIISIAGVIIFTGLTAYDTQKIKNWGNDSGDSARASIMGALTLYLDFINLFLFLLRLLGKLKD